MSTRPRCRARPSIEAPSTGSTISGNRVTMWIRISGCPAGGLQAEQAGRRPDHVPPGRHVDVDHDLGDRRDQMLALGALHDPQVLAGARLDPRDVTDVATVFRGHPGAFELP